MTDKEAMQMALETAEQIASADYRHWEELASLGEFERWARSRANHIAEALRARLAQPENDFNPDWDAMAVMVEEQQRMAKRIEELEARLAQPEQEPVGINKVIIDSIRDSSEIVAPPKREWVGLTDEDKKQIAIEANNKSEMTAWEYAHRVGNFTEAKLKEKNT